MRRFVVLVSGTLVYSRGDEREGKKVQEDGPSGEERLLPAASSERESAQPVAVAGSAPISVRQTPGSFKVRCKSHTWQNQLYTAYICSLCYLLHLFCLRILLLNE